MGTRKTRDLPARLEEVRRQFEHWRQTRKIPSRIPGRCGRRRQGSPAHAGFPVLPRRYGSTIKHSNSTSTRVLRPVESLESEPPNNANHRLTVVRRPPPFSNWSLPCELALANACWSWRIPPGRKCESMSKVLRRPT